MPPTPEGRVDQEAAERITRPARLALKHVIGQDHRGPEIAQNIADARPDRARNHGTIADGDWAEDIGIDALMDGIESAVGWLRRVIGLLVFSQGLWVGGGWTGGTTGEKQGGDQWQGACGARQREGGTVWLAHR